LRSTHLHLANLSQQPGLCLLHRRGLSSFAWTPSVVRCRSTCSEPSLPRAIRPCERDHPGSRLRPHVLPESYIRDRATQSVCTIGSLEGERGAGRTSHMPMSRTGPSEVMAEDTSSVGLSQITTTLSRSRLLSCSSVKMPRSRVASLPSRCIASPKRYASETC
jgi:hypothetical protein